VCEQREWEAMESANPGHRLLVHQGIKTEQEAEKLARGTAGDAYRRGTSKQTLARPEPTTSAAPPEPTG